jgi:putative ATP-dependent endonuclease of OLD family
MANELIFLKREDYNGLRLALIEELEAHLHPQAQLRVLKSLLKR